MTRKSAFHSVTAIMDRVVAQFLKPPTKWGGPTYSDCRDVVNEVEFYEHMDQVTSLMGDWAKERGYVTVRQSGAGETT